MTATRTGVLISESKGLSPSDIEGWGFHSLWCTEGTDDTAFPRLSRWATQTDHIRLGTGIVNVYSRSPALLAMEIISLDRVSDGRALLGLGTSHDGIVEGVHGIPYEKPLARMKEYIQLIKQYLSDEDGPFEGEFHSVQTTAFREGFEPVQDDIPIYNAAVGTQNIRLTGQCADGWFPIHYPPNLIHRGRTLLEEGAEGRNRSVDEIDVAVVLLCAVDRDRDKARNVMLKELSYYTNHRIYYERFSEDAGFPEETRILHEAQPRVEQVADRISDEFLDALCIFGTPAEAQDKLRSLCRETGVDQPILFLPRAADEEMARRSLETLSPSAVGD